MRIQPHPEMTALLKTFPLMERKLAYWPYDIVKDPVVRNAYHGASSGECLVIDFLLSVWDASEDWEARGFANFNLVRAVGILSNIEPIIAWMRKPFRP